MPAEYDFLQFQRHLDGISPQWYIRAVSPDSPKTAFCKRCQYPKFSPVAMKVENSGS